MLGFIPFLIGEVSDFWFSLALGTMSGLGFSLLVLILILPVMFRGKAEKSKDERGRAKKRFKQFLIAITHGKIRFIPSGIE